MRTAPLVIVLVLLALAFAAPSQAATLTSAERMLLGEVNRVRAVHGLGPLQVGRKLQLAARAHATDMLRRNYFAHGAFLSRLLRYGAAGPVFGENLAWGSGSRAQPRAIVAGWLSSPGHRANLLRRGFVRVGIAAPSGTFRGIRGVRMVTANFAGR